MSPVGPPCVAVIVLNWNGGADTIECLESLFHVRYPRFTVYLLDNGSSDDSVDLIKAYARGLHPVQSPFFQYDPSNKPVATEEIDFTSRGVQGKAVNMGRERSRMPPLVLLRSPENLGFSRGNNIAMRLSATADQPDYFLLLNNDTVVHQDVLTELVRVAESDASIGVVGAKILYYSSQSSGSGVQFAGGSFDLGKFPGYFPLTGGTSSEPNNDSPVQCQWVSGTAMLIRAQIAAATALDESFFFGCEDVDYCLTLASEGFRVVFSPRAIVWHKGGVSRRKRFAGKRLWLWLDELKSTLRLLGKHRGSGSRRTAVYFCQAVVGRTREAVRNLRISHSAREPDSNGRWSSE